MKNGMLLAMLALAPALMSGPAAAQGGDVGQQMEREMGVVERDSREGRRLNNQLDDVVERIVQGVNSENRDREFRLKTAKVLGGKSEKHDKIVNAFALPDGRIYVTLGLMRLIQDSAYRDDELAFVVGHEVTHVAERHAQSQMKKSLPVNILAILLGAATKNKTVGDIAGAGAAAYTSSFSRKDEYRADRGGLLAMYHARYELDAASSMLGRLKSQGEEQNKTITGWFGSHPLTANRVDRVKEMVRDLRRYGEIRDRSDEVEKEDRQSKRRR